MSLRAWLAGQAIGGLIAVEPSDCIRERNKYTRQAAQDFARTAVELADALLAELEKERQ